MPVVSNKEREESVFFLKRYFDNILVLLGFLMIEVK